MCHVARRVAADFRVTDERSRIADNYRDSQPSDVEKRPEGGGLKYDSVAGAPVSHRLRTHRQGESHSLPLRSSLLIS